MMPVQEIRACDGGDGGVFRHSRVRIIRAIGELYGLSRRDSTDLVVPSRIRATPSISGNSWSSCKKITMPFGSSIRFGSLGWKAGSCGILICCQSVACAAACGMAAVARIDAKNTRAREKRLIPDLLA